MNKSMEMVGVSESKSKMEDCNLDLGNLVFAILAQSTVIFVHLVCFIS